MMVLAALLSNGDKCFIALVVVAGVVVALWRGRDRDRKR